MQPHNYRYLRKFLHYTRSTIPKVTFTTEAKIMIGKYYALLKTNKNLGMTPRALEILIRICKAWARLHLKDIVDANTVNQVQSYFSIILLQYGEVIRASIDPREVACDEIVKIIKKTIGPILFEEAAKEACHTNQLVNDYIGQNLKLRDNKRLEEISKRVREHSNVAVVGLKPLILELIKENSDSVNSLQTGFASENGA
jgi:DNA replicative helicase MCM subunit Mcm2 (Cdc46/Mcm family)